MGFFLKKRGRHQITSHIIVPSQQDWVPHIPIIENAAGSTHCSVRAIRFQVPSTTPQNLQEAHNSIEVREKQMQPWQRKRERERERRPALYTSYCRATTKSSICHSRRRRKAKQPFLGFMEGTLFGREHEGRIEEEPPIFLFCIQGQTQLGSCMHPSIWKEGA